MFVQEYLLFKISIVLTGFYSGGIYVVAPLYLVEIIGNDRLEFFIFHKNQKKKIIENNWTKLSFSSFRGAILTSLILSTCFGEMLAFGANLFLKNNFIALWFLIPLIVMATILFYSFPDSCISLLKRKKFAERKIDLQFDENMLDWNQIQIAQNYCHVWTIDIDFH